ncbi:LRRcap domain-containing protein [Caenorhabditis elegans]|uniref:LRRcap domain-containing protein n=1 Tax=Caenorhabditis elegans TaxID=6239 RepID=O45885_CAEEL|nr:LRRcap domain-containing protein [Caenorhabditis elegans]CCD71909.1 LRRcap domain-containing protein [Caenorhabditis elegans]|eukprot:NP_500547.1 Uncharacterized protein CELE_W03B1.5 [Caenorhabditis elegans]
MTALRPDRQAHFMQQFPKWQILVVTNAEAKEAVLKLCPAVKKLIIQTKLSDFEAVRLNKLNLKLTKLYISNENLGLVNFPKFEKLRTLHLVVDSTKKLKIVDVVEPRVLKAGFPQTLTRVCLTGIYLTENLLDHLASLKNLACLDLIGCLVDTRVGAKYVSKLEKMENLDDLSIPPSMFSFSSKVNTSVDFNLCQLKVSKIGIYMDQYDDDNFFSQTRHFLPKNLKILVIFGNYFPMKKKKNQLSGNKNILILFGPNTSLASCPQANLTDVYLLSHLVRRSPYIPQEYSPNFLRNHDVIIGNLAWQFSLIEWKDNNGSRRDVLELRNRLNVAPDQDVVFEGVTIAPPVILDRLARFRERRRMPIPAGSPNEFQVFDRVLPAPPLQVGLVGRVPPPPPPPPPRRRSRSRDRPRLVFSNIGGSARRRTRSAPPAIQDVPAVPVRRSDSMLTNPPSPVGTRTGAVFTATLPMITPIGGPSAASQIGGTAPVTTEPATSVLNRGFIETLTSTSRATIGSSESRRLSTASQASTSLNSEMTIQTTATASPERLPAPPGNPPARVAPSSLNEQNNNDNGPTQNGNEH